MDRFARTVLGYHGCDQAFAETILRGERSVEQWEPSRNPYDWLGHGIYFWEYGPERAAAWGGGVVGAIIQVGRCLDLTDVAFTKRLREAHRALRTMSRLEGTSLPKNKGKRRDLDCAVINYFVQQSSESGQGAIQTARCPFLEGVPAFPGSGIRRDSHIQLVVFDKRCLLGVFRPTA